VIAYKTIALMTALDVRTWREGMTITFRTQMHLSPDVLQSTEH
jgi:hypothetical protein